MSGSNSYKQVVMLYIHPNDFAIIRAAATAAQLSLHDFLLLGAWKSAREYRDREENLLLHLAES